MSILTTQQQPGLAELLAGGLGQGLQTGASSLLNQLQQKELLQTKQAGELEKAKMAQQRQDMQKIAPLITGLDTLKRQRELLSTGHLGPMFGIGGTGRKAFSTFSPEGRQARAEYERLGKSLISLATNIPIRNKLEFETLSAKLFDPDATQEEIQGSLDAMQRIIENNLSGYGYGSQPLQGQPQNQQDSGFMEEGKIYTNAAGRKITLKDGKIKEI